MTSIKKVEIKKTITYQRNNENKQENNKVILIIDKKKSKIIIENKIKQLCI